MQNADAVQVAVNALADGVGRIEEHIIAAAPRVWDAHVAGIRIEAIGSLAVSTVVGVVVAAASYRFICAARLVEVERAKAIKAGRESGPYFSPSDAPDPTAWYVAAAVTCFIAMMGLLDIIIDGPRNARDIFAPEQSAIHEIAELVK